MNTQTDLSRVLEKIAEIAEKSADDDYIYRGEPECYEKVSSSLYREYPHTEGIRFDIANFQKASLEEAKAYISETDDIDETDDIGILTELQHFGGKTNLIDFTEDYLIALFFACDGSHDKEGKVILLKRESDDYAIRKPRRTINRVESQKSVFVESSTGFVEPDGVVTIPMDLKFPMLHYLEKYHRISIATIYNDLHGFIRRSAYIEFLKGLTNQRKADEAKTRDKKHKHYENAVRHYTEALKLKPDFAGAYNNRGNVHSDKGELNNAIQDFNTAIELSPELAEAYNNRGNVHSGKGELDAAIQNYNKVLELNPEYAETYYNRGNAYGRKDKFDNAIQDYNKAIALNPEYADAYNNRSVAYRDKGDFDVAIQDCNKVIELNPEHINAYYNRGKVYCKKGEFDGAIQNFNTAINLNPEYADAYYNRGGVWLHLSEWEKARADLNTAKDMGIDIVASFHNDYESVADFEKTHGVKVPEDIAALLSRNGN